MSRFSPADRARVLAESKRILEDKPPEPPPAPAPEPPPLAFKAIDPVREWRERADALDREREANRAALRREQRADERARGADWWSEIEAHIDQRIAAALAERQYELTELARSTVEFANAVDRRLAALERLLTKLSATHKQLREHDAREPIDMPSPLIRKERLIN
jgi:hypothetical protein